MSSLDKCFVNIETWMSSHTSPEITIAICNQQQLEPYLLSVLLHSKLILSSPVLVIHPASKYIGSAFYSNFPNVLGIDIAPVQKEAKFFIQKLFANLKHNGIYNINLILHNFGDGVNYELFLLLLNKQSPELNSIAINQLICLTDGSRNNSEPEFDPGRETHFYNNLLPYYPHAKLCSFGFLKDPLANSEDVIDYAYVDASFNLLPRLTETREDKITADSYNLLLTRYWGKHPYLLKSDTKYTVSRLICDHAKRLFKSNLPLIIKPDDRIPQEQNNITKKLEASHEVMNISDLISAKSSNYNLNDVLFEILIRENPLLIQKLHNIYSLDSSFPLIFQSPVLYRALPHHCKLIIGLDIELVKQHGSVEFFETALRRASELISSVIECKLFNIFNLDGAIVQEICPSGYRSPTNIGAQEMLLANGGFLVLRKP